MSQPEYKFINARFIVKELDEETGTIEGYGSVFNTVDHGNDIVLPGAFKRSLREHKRNKSMPKMLWQHDITKPIGRWNDIAEDDKGLVVSGKLLIDSDPLARTAHAHLQEKSIDGLSIGFTVADYKIRKDDGIRELKTLDLWEVSVVTFAMNPSARVESVKASDFINSRKDFEAALRNVMGLSVAEAKRVAAQGYSGLLRNVEAEDISQYIKPIHEFLKGVEQ